MYIKLHLDEYDALSYNILPNGRTNGCVRNNHMFPGLPIGRSGKFCLTGYFNN